MTSYAFIELPPALAGWVEDTGALFPVQSHLADDLTRAAAPDPERILFDLEQYLEEHPAKQARFAAPGAQLAFRTAVELFTSGLREASLQFYELSLRLRPHDVLTRLNYAVALHALCYRSAALAEYERLMASTTPREHPRIWILAAQIHAAHRRYVDVVRVLAPLAASVFPQDNEYWALLGTARAALGGGGTSAVAVPLVAPTAKRMEPVKARAGRAASPPSPAPASSPTPPMPPSSVGRPVAAVPSPAPPLPPPPAAAALTPTCRHCGQPRRASAKFCGSCGKP
jgi:hypothetical protein